MVCFLAEIESRNDGEENVERLLNFLCELGIRLIRSGAEIYRVEFSIELVAKAYGYEKIDVFAIPAFVLINIECNGKNHTKSVRVSATKLNLDRLQRINSLTRKICREKVTLEQAEKELFDIIEKPRYPKWIIYIAHGLVAAFFTLFFGGNIFDFWVSFVCGLSIKATGTYLGKQKTNLFFANLLESTILAIPPIVLSVFFPQIHLDTVITGAIMLLVPGVAITNVMRDVLAGDMLTAVTKFAEVMIVGMGIAVGIALPIGLEKVILAALV